ncbi:MAG: hypothetical protein EZS28_037313, partial [Streblomastix strix]
NTSYLTLMKWRKWKSPRESRDKAELRQRLLNVFGRIGKG